MRALRATVARLGILVILLLPSPNVIHGQQRPSVDELLQQFESATAIPLIPVIRPEFTLAHSIGSGGTIGFTQQFVVAKAIVAANDRSVLPRLEPWLAHPDRCLRGNAAYIFGRLGDPRGCDVIVAILGDRSAEREVRVIPSVGLPWIQGQIRQDRYYAAHLLGDLKDPRAIPILVRLLTDADVMLIVPWSLGQIGDKSAIEPLIQTLNDRNTNMRVLVIYALVDLKAREALPLLRQLLDDNTRSNFGKLESVAEAAQAAIAKLQTETAR